MKRNVTFVFTFSVDIFVYFSVFSMAFCGKLTHKASLVFYPESADILVPSESYTETAGKRLGGTTLRQLHAEYFSSSLVMIPLFLVAGVVVTLDPSARRYLAFKLRPALKLR